MKAQEWAPSTRSARRTVPCSRWRWLFATPRTAAHQDPLSSIMSKSLLNFMSTESDESAAKSLQSCPTLCNPIDGSPPGSPVPGILQARTLGCVAISFSNAWKWKVKTEREVAQSCPTLSHPMDCGPPGSSIHGIFQARVLEWGATAFSERLSTILFLRSPILTDNKDFDPIVTV